MVALLRGSVEIEYFGAATARGEVVDLRWDTVGSACDNFSAIEATAIEAACGRDLRRRQAEWRMLKRRVFR